MSSKYNNMSMNTPRILIGLCEIAGYNGSLKRGFDELGIKASFVELSQHPFQFEGDAINNAWIRFIKFLNARRSSAKNSILPVRVFTALSYYLSVLPVFLWAVIRFDTFIFVFGQSFFRLYDLPLLKFLGKRIIFTFLGSESRPPYINRKCYRHPISECIELSAQVKNNVKRIEHYADIIITHPASSHFIEKKFICGMQIGIPTTFDVISETASSGSNVRKAVRILHAPSYAEGKGTDKIREAISNLRKSGHQIDYIELDNRPNAEVLDEIRKCDFIVDELYSDSVMARFAAEAAFFKKPAIVGGYSIPYDWGNLPAADIPPVHYCRPDEIEAAIEKLISDKPYRENLGVRAWEFLHSRWSARIVAARYLRLIQDDFPDDWLYDPRNIRYLYGWGLPEDFLKDFLGRYLAEGGKQSLFLSDKPELEQLLVEFTLAKPIEC